MASRLHLILDVNFLAWRSFYAMGGLGYDGNVTGTLYGVFKELQNLKELFDTEHIIFCFDSKQSKRREIYPAYKASRQAKYETMPRTELRAYAAFRDQVHRLEHTYLPRIGYRNIVVADGYEADDMIAAACGALPRQDIGMVVGTDSDLFQLLGPRISIWNPVKKKCITEESFRQMYGVSAGQWADVKAITGCNTDDVEGIRGVGEITAVKFLTGKLDPGSKAFDKIVKGNGIWRRNLPLVRLPYEGCPVPVLVADAVTQEGWGTVMDELGMKSIRELNFV